MVSFARVFGIFTTMYYLAKDKYFSLFLSIDISEPALYSNTLCMFGGEHI